MVVLGIDPGLTGAAALVLNERLLDVFQFPTETFETTGKINRRIDARLLTVRLEHALGDRRSEAFAVVEAQRGMPEQASTSVFSLGESTGIIRGVLGAMGITLSRTVQPKQWKAHFGLDDGKRASVERAAALFPDYAADFKRVADHNKAEAALIALWGWGKLA